MPETFGCCSSYRECSETGRCVHSDDDEYTGCQYRRNLEKGRNFYGSQFFISVKGSNWWSYNATNEQKAEALRILEGANITRIPEAPGSCTSRVTITANDCIYVVYAPGTRLMPEAAAQEIARKLGDMARVEVMARERRPSVTPPPARIKEVVPILEPAKKPVYTQISFFDLMGDIL